MRSFISKKSERKIFDLGLKETIFCLTKQMKKNNSHDNDNINKHKKNRSVSLSSCETHFRLCVRLFVICWLYQNEACVCLCCAKAAETQKTQPNAYNEINVRQTHKSQRMICISLFIKSSKTDQNAHMELSFSSYTDSHRTTSTI